mgnify:CR=1 FL=1
MRNLNFPKIIQLNGMDPIVIVLPFVLVNVTCLLTKIIIQIIGNVPDIIYMEWYTRSIFWRN